MDEADNYFDSNSESDGTRHKASAARLIVEFETAVSEGRYEDAMHIYRSGIRDPLYWYGNDIATCAKLINHLFLDGLNAPPAVIDPVLQAKIILEAAILLSQSGQHHQAILLFQQHAENCRQHEALDELANCYLWLSDDQRILGEFAAAQKSLQQCIAIYSQLGLEIQRAWAYTDMARLLLYMGNPEAKLYLDVAEGPLSRTDIVLHSTGLSLLFAKTAANRVRQAIFEKNSRMAMEVARNAYNLLRSQRHASTRCKVRAQLLLALALMASSEHASVPHELFSEADYHLSQARIQCQQAGDNDYAVEVGCVYSQLQMHLGNTEQARIEAGRTLADARRMGHRLDEAEIQLLHAHIAMKEHDGTRAQTHAKAAYDCAMLGGPPYCYQPALSEAETLLKSIEKP